MKNRLVLLIIIAIFVAQALSLNFTQDDFFMTCRYAKDFTEGKGLFFNAGKTVEGHTD